MGEGLPLAQKSSMHQLHAIDAATPQRRFCAVGLREVSGETSVDDVRPGQVDGVASLTQLGVGRVPAVPAAALRRPTLRMQQVQEEAAPRKLQPCNASKGGSNQMAVRCMPKADLHILRQAADKTIVLPRR